jgi:hypothetical protein
MWKIWYEVSRKLDLKMFGRVIGGRRREQDSGGDTAETSTCIEI